MFHLMRIHSIQGKVCWTFHFLRAAVQWKRLAAPPQHLQRTKFNWKFSVTRYSSLKIITRFSSNSGRARKWINSYLFHWLTSLLLLNFGQNALTHFKLILRRQRRTAEQPREDHVDGNLHQGTDISIGNLNVLYFRRWNGQSVIFVIEPESLMSTHRPWNIHRSIHRSPLVLIGYRLT